MKLPGVKTAKSFSRWVQARIYGGALILGYHRVAEVESDDYEVCVSPEHFEQQMYALRKYTRPIRLAKLVQCLKVGAVPPSSVAVTFDDGYADNLYEAKPVLEKYEIPATVFVCSGYQGREFWWDELDRLIMTSKADSSVLRLAVGEKPFDRDRHKVISETSFADYRNLRRALYNFLLGLDVEERNQAMDAIRNWSGFSSSDVSSARSLSSVELLSLADGGLIEIGAHTRFHPILPRLVLEQQKDEILSSKLELEEILERKVEGFAYPHGRATLESTRIVAEAGFSYACTSLQDVVRPGSDLHGLTRFWQKDVDGDKFMQTLNRWLKNS
ncbi:MAG TPA: polysaccharide deacetylase family protein [Anaerolineales bacterium]|nr:polysaccharide deacetylase family protein [Anaerolineales bacterium]